MTILGGVPISVIIPPILLAKAIGMSTLDGAWPASCDMAMAMGIMRATVPVLLTKAPMAAVTMTMSASVSVSRPCERRRMERLAALAIPV